DVYKRQGLGPTADDVNRDVFAKVFRTALIHDAKAEAMMRERFARRGRTMPESNLVQARVPEGAVILHNEWGTAPGFFLAHRLDDPENQVATPCALLALPGPPRELYPMFREKALPILRPYFAGNRYVLTRVLHTFGALESELGQCVKDLFASEPDYTFTMLAKPHGVDIRIVVRAATRQQAEQRLAEIEEETRRRISPELIYGVDEETLPLVVARALSFHKATLVTAESCTGGLIAKLLTDIAGSSAFFLRGYVTYSNQAKVELLGVSSKTLEEKGAVSAETAEQMARGAKKAANADYALAVTGIAGPTGGSAEKPVGLTYIALAQGEDVSVRRYVFPGDRDFNRTFAALTALNWLRLELLRHPRL
ncbi:MAG: CinA family nicotinamide mononucleotide deamidase-related protein, partial [Candidatus Sumerlaeaceae bacterium]|nr:CinA family nicotinamide mononucleotide deamidase-related protein [Candidatus Sumerlaeaceae bacterium]